MNVVVFSVFLSSRAEYCYLRGGGGRQYECCCLLCVSIFEGRILLLTGGGSMNVVVFSVFLSSRAEYCYLRGGGDSMNVVVFSVFLSSRAEYCYLRGGGQYECCCLLCVSIFEGRILLLTGGETV